MVRSGISLFFSRSKDIGYNRGDNKMKTIIFWVWVYNVWRIKRALNMDWSLKDIIHECKEDSWILDVATQKIVEAE